MRRRIAASARWQALNEFALKSATIFRSYPTPTSHLSETRVPLFPGRDAVPEPSDHHLDRDEFFDRFDIAASSDLDPEAPPPAYLFAFVTSSIMAFGRSLVTI